MDVKFTQYCIIIALPPTKLQSHVQLEKELWETQCIGTDDMESVQICSHERPC